jgi:hypothetical protein
VSVLYRVNFKADTDAKIGDWFKAEGLGAAMEKVRKRSKMWKGPYLQGDWSEKGFGPPRQDWSEACDQFKKALNNNGVGDTRVMKDGASEAKIAVRKVDIPDVDYPSVASNSTPRVKAFIKPVWDEFPQLTSWGIYNCRRIAGSSSFSEHAWADAIDLHAPSMAYGDQVYRWCMTNKGRFDITRVLWRQASHYDHLHVDFDPDHSGTPPCA